MGTILSEQWSQISHSIISKFVILSHDTQASENTAINTPIDIAVCNFVC